MRRSANRTVPVDRRLLPMSTENSLPRVIGERLRLERSQRDLSLGSLAKSANVGKGTLSEIEAGIRNPTLSTLYALAKALDVPLSELIAEQTGAELESPGIHARLLDSLTNETHRIEVFALELAPDIVHVSDAHGAHVTENILVTQGRASVGRLDAQVTLETGESTSWVANSTHSYRALDDSPARCVLTMFWRRDGSIQQA